MNKWDLTIELKSDFCTAVGESSSGLINNKTALEDGIPYIPAKRIKGCLLEAARELADNGIIKEETLHRIFGRPGMDRGEGIRVSSGYLSVIPEYFFEREKSGKIAVRDYARFQRALRECTDIETSLLEDIFTRKRSRTALSEETQAAKEHSLRTIQVVPAGVVFSSRIEGEAGPEEETALLLCARGLRHMGTGITRGMGEVRCTLKKAAQDPMKHGKGKAKLPENIPFGEEVCLSYEIELETPVILADEAEDGMDQIPGNAILGALAGMYIKKYSLGDNAHEDEDFRRIFLRDGTQFGNAFFKKGGVGYAPCPGSFAIAKDDREVWFNVCNEDKRRIKISKQISLKGNTLYTAAPEKEIHFHHARPADRGIAHPLNDRAEDKSLPAGQFFQYIALSKHQTFAGTIRGRAGDIKKLADCLEENQHRLTVGRSRTAEYGSCVLRILGIQPVKRQSGNSIKGKDWLVWLVSPLIYRNQQNGAYETGTGPLLKQMKKELGCGVAIVDVDSYCSSTVFHGYNSKWKLPGVSCPALAAGSAFHITTDIEVEAGRIENKRYGIFTGKGCGQVKAILWEDGIKGGAVKEACATVPGVVPEMEIRTDEDNELLSMIRDFQKKRLESEAAALRALEAIDKQGDKLPSSSDISLLIQLWRGQREDKGYYQNIQKEVNRIKKEEKKNRILKFIEPCQNESLPFIREYLKVAKWKAR